MPCHSRSKSRAYEDLYDYDDASFGFSTPSSGNSYKDYYSDPYYSARDSYEDHKDRHSETFGRGSRSCSTHGEEDDYDYFNCKPSHEHGRSHSKCHKYDEYDHSYPRPSHHHGSSAHASRNCSTGRHSYSSGNHTSYADSRYSSAREYPFSTSHYASYEEPLTSDTHSHSYSSGVPGTSHRHYQPRVVPPEDISPMWHMWEAEIKAFERDASKCGKKLYAQDYDEFDRKWKAAHRQAADYNEEQRYHSRHQKTSSSRPSGEYSGRKHESDHHKSYREPPQPRTYEQYNSRPHTKKPTYTEPPVEPFEEVDNYYAILGISSHATTDEIKKAAKKKRIEVHPDRKRKPGMTAKQCQEIDEIAFSVGLAADTLLNPREKAEYDRNLMRGAKGNASFWWEVEFLLVMLVTEGIRIPSVYVLLFVPIPCLLVLVKNGMLSN